MTKDYSKIIFPASPESLPDIISFVEDRAGAAGLASAKLNGLCLAVEEAFINICTHSLKDDSEGEVEMICFSASGSFVLEIADPGPEFDMLSVPEPDISAEIEQREVGGLGVHLIRHFTDCADWRRENNKNILRLTMSLDDTGKHKKET